MRLFALLVCLFFLTLASAPAFCEETPPESPAASVIVNRAVREVRKYRRAYDEATERVLSETEKKLNDEVVRLLQAGQGNLKEALAIRRIIGTLGPTVTKRAEAPIPVVVVSPPPMEKWIIGRWSGVNTPHIFNFKEGGGFEGIGKAPNATNVFGTWKSEQQGYINVEVANGNAWTIRRCGPNAMAVVVTNEQDKQQGDGIVLLRELDPVVGKWKWHDSTVRELWGDGQVKDHPRAFWKVEDPTRRTYCFSWGGGAVIDMLVLSADGATLRGRNGSGAEVTAERLR